MSVGNVTQAINFDRSDLTLVLGENLDLGGDDNGSRNGTGKTTIANALSYGIFGQALTNIKRENLINKTNGKGMIVTIEFEKDGIDYRIERGRRPNVLALYCGGAAFAAKDNDAQGDSRETQHEINRIVGMSHDMFKHIVALNTYTEPFLSLRANDQRPIIEQLLGITMLSEKAEKLKEQSRISKDIITSEEYRIKAELEANKKIEEQIVSLRRRQTMWNNKHAEDLTRLQTSINELMTIDIESEISLHQQLAEYVQKKKDINDLELALSRGNADIARERKSVAKLEPEIAALKNHQCHACGQELHNEKQMQNLATKEQQLAEINDRITELTSYNGQIEQGIELLGKLGVEPVTYYKNIGDAYNHKTSVEHQWAQLEDKKKDENPYDDQIVEMETKALTEIDYTEINKATKLREHQEFLFKLLTNKDSFIRKRIIDQNLTYLNARLSYYLGKIGLPHVVVFQNDLTVSIEELGRELDFDNLSRGERGRLILSLSWAFRNVWESLYSSVNLLFIDELIDNGLDASGVESAMGILKKMTRDTHKSVWLVSHKDELTSRVGNILRVVKSGGFTEYKDDEAVWFLALVMLKYYT